jgi:DNA-binding MarR family transcriptional regulator
MNPNDLSSLLNEWVMVFTRRSMGDFVRFTKTYNLSMPQVNVLFHLYLVGPCGVATIQNYIAGSNAAASQIVERLQQQGLVERHEIDGDRRVRMVTLTPRGRQIVQERYNERQEWIRDLAGSLSPEEQAVVSSALSLLLEKAGILAQKNAVYAAEMAQQKDEILA